MEAIIRHIESFPKVKSHYCNKCYLDPLLNIKKMNELFTEKCEIREMGFENVKPVHFQVYRIGGHFVRNTTYHLLS